MIEQKQKLLFGLSPKSTIINVFILIFLASIMWAIKYLQQFSQYRKKQAGYIENTQRDLNGKIVILDRTLKEKPRVDKRRAGDCSCGRICGFTQASAKGGE